MARVLAVDIGIKNLAWCCASKSTTLDIHGWENENLVTGTNENFCTDCKKKPSYIFRDLPYCVKHCTPLRDAKGGLLRKIPPVAVLKEIAKTAGASPSETKTKETTLAFLQKKVALPLIAKKASSLSLSDIHDGIRAVVKRNHGLFSSCTMILLENQPAFKNPVMKSVQMMLFATLRDLLDGPPEIRLVHASKKSAGATKGDEGYSERKNMTEAMVEKGLEDGSMVCSKGRSWFSSQAKKSDLADCLIMTQDYLTGLQRQPKEKTNAGNGET
jgi:hypothetical protein